jgi:hypothetical protein
METADPAKTIRDFLDHAPMIVGEITNEISLQLELGIALRQSGFVVEFERHFVGQRLLGSSKKAKSYLDIFVKKDGKTTAIELKVPLSGQHPETMYEFCADVEFVESIVRAGKASEGICLLLTNDRVFWQDSGRGSAIHNLFRCTGTEASSSIPKPTG